MAERADGSIVVDVDLDAEGFKAGSAELQRAVKSFSAQAGELGPAFQKAMSGNMNAIAAFNGKAQLLESTMANVRREMTASADKLVDTQESEALASAVEKAKKAEEQLQKQVSATQILQTRTDILLQVGGTYATKEQVSSSLELTAENILAEVDKKIPDGAEMEELRSSVEQTAEAITAEVTRAKGQEQALSSKIEQTAGSINLSVENGEKSSTIKLTGDGITAQSKQIKFTGEMLFASNLTDGETVISGENIQTGKIRSKNGKVYFDLENNELRCDRLVSTSSILAINGKSVQPAYADITREDVSGGVGSPRYMDALRIYNGESEDDALLLAPGNSSAASQYFKYKKPTIYGKSLTLDADDGMEVNPGGTFYLNLGTDASGQIEGLILEPGFMALNGFGEVVIGGTVFLSYAKTTVDSSARGIGIDTDGQLHRLSSSSRRYKHSIRLLSSWGTSPSAGLTPSWIYRSTPAPLQ